jgi:hypothetical protein
MYVCMYVCMYLKNKLVLVILSEVIFVFLLLVLCKCLESNWQFILEMDSSVCASDACGGFIRPN